MAQECMQWVVVCMLYWKDLLDVQSMIAKLAVLLMGTLIAKMMVAALLMTHVSMCPVVVCVVNTLKVFVVENLLAAHLGYCVEMLVA